MSSNRSTARWVAGALLGVVALGLAAATLPSTVTEPRGGGASGPPGPGSGWGPMQDLPDPPMSTIDVPWLTELLQALLLLAVLGTVVWALRNRREALWTFLLATAGLALAYLLFRNLDGFELPGGGNATQAGGGGDGAMGGGMAETGATQLDLPVGVLLAVLGLAVAVAVAAVLRAGDDDSDDVPSADDDRAAAVGRAAGRAAERIRDGTDADNEVYRAWREMTDLLDVPNPESSTPGEFASAAVEAGMTREEVDELTRLFESVRYGGAEPSAGLERRAVAAFEGIEAAYAEET